MSVMEAHSRNTPLSERGVRTVYCTPKKKSAGGSKVVNG